jgi:hypothetical protein
MAIPITLKQTMTLTNGGRELLIRQQQGGRVTHTKITLKEPVHKLKEISEITELTDQWPRTSVSIDGQFQANNPTDSQQE